MKPFVIILLAASTLFSSCSKKNQYGCILTAEDGSTYKLSGSVFSPGVQAAYDEYLRTGVFRYAGTTYTGTLTKTCY